MQISSKEAAYRLGITDQALRKRRTKGIGPPYEKQANGWIYYNDWEIEKWKKDSSCSKRPEVTKTCGAGGSPKS